MIKLNIPVGISDFKKIRENGYYYVDKTGLIFELVKEEPAEVTLITRPRRFGKTLGMSMLAHFFDIRQDNAKLFQGLEITKHSSLCSKWMNQYPTVYLTLKDVDGLTFSSAYEMLSAAVTDLYKEHLYLLDSKKISTYDKGIILRIAKEEATVTDIKKSLVNLIRLLEIHYEKKVILLLDEYDVPLAKASSHGYYAQMLEVIRSLLGTALKDNRSLNFAVITGCLKIAKESIFTGTNNFVPDTITDSGLNEYFGFTQKDVDQILKEAKAEAQTQNIRDWYDGYHFGEFDIYCPWDVMNYLRDLKMDPKAKPVGYWKNTSDNGIIRSFIDYAGSSITKKLETLLAGGYIIQHIDEDLTYDYLHSSEENLWSILYLTGYLTKVREKDLEKSIAPEMTALMIPNQEIREIFENSVVKWFDDSAKIWDRKSLFTGVWTGNSQIITQEMNKLLRRTISYHDYKEDFYHAFLAGIFTGAGYVVESNKEHGEGRSDIAVFAPEDGCAAVFEVKYSKTVEGMQEDCEKALQQIDNRMYTDAYEDEYDHIFCYGISFYKKRCLVLARENQVENSHRL